MYSMISPQSKWRPFSNPAPLGNSGFAVSTFVSSLHTGAIGIVSGAPPNIVVGLALFYGGFAQILAGAWSFASNNGFGAVVFTSYGCYWLSYAATMIPGFGIDAILNGLSADIRAQSLGIFYLVWVLQTFIFVLGSSRSNWGTFTLLVFLLLTNILTCVGHWSQRDDVLHASGYIGMLTAIIAWYNVAVDMLNKETFYFDLPNPSIGMNILPEAIEPAVHTPYCNEMCKQHQQQQQHQQHQTHMHHSHHHINAFKLEGHTPGNHFEFVSALPRATGTTNHHSGASTGSRIRSDSVHSVGFEDNSNVRTIVADMTLSPPPQLSNMSSRFSDRTRIASSNGSKLKYDEITQVE